MFISRKKYKELEDKMEKLRLELGFLSEKCGGYYDLERKVECLGELHNLKEVTLYYSFKHDSKYVCEHNLILNTEKIKNITLDELAKFIIDNTPIKRIENVNVEYRK